MARGRPHYSKQYYLREFSNQRTNLLKLISKRNLIIAELKVCVDAIKAQENHVALIQSIVEVEK